MMFHNVSKCQTISHPTPQCFIMSRNISDYLTMSYNISECVPQCGFNILSAKNWSLHMSPKYADTYRRGRDFQIKENNTFVHRNMVFLFLMRSIQFILLNKVVLLVLNFSDLNFSECTVLNY